MSSVTVPRADEPFGVKVKKDFQHTLCDYIATLLPVGVVGTDLPQNQSCAGSTILCECMNRESVGENRCWYRENVTVTEKEGEIGRTSRCIHSSVDNKQTTTMA